MGWNRYGRGRTKSRTRTSSYDTKIGEVKTSPSLAVPIRRHRTSSDGHRRFAVFPSGAVAGSAAASAGSGVPVTGGPSIRQHWHHILRQRYVGYVLFPGRYWLFERQLPRPFRLLFARANAADRWAPAAERCGFLVVREMPQEYASVHARGHQTQTVWAYPHVGDDSRMTHPHVCGYALVVQPNLHRLIRTAGHEVLACGSFNTTVYNVVVVNNIMILLLLLVYPPNLYNYDTIPKVPKYRFLIVIEICRFADNL